MSGQQQKLDVEKNSSEAVALNGNRNEGKLRWESPAISLLQYGHWLDRGCPGRPVATTMPECWIPWPSAQQSRWWEWRIQKGDRSEGKGVESAASRVGAPLGPTNVWNVLPKTGGCLVNTHGASWKAIFLRVFKTNGFFTKSVSEHPTPWISPLPPFLFL